MAQQEPSDAHATASDRHAQHSAQLRALIQELERDHLAWYARQQNRHYWLWIGLEVVAVGAPLLTTIFAGIASALALFDHAWVKCILVTLPALAVAASSLLARLGVREMEHTRETGRHAFEGLIRHAKLEASCAQDVESLLAVHRHLLAESARIDAEQHQAHHRVTAASRHRSDSPGRVGSR